MKTTSAAHAGDRDAGTASKTAQPARKQRLELFDNIKALLIVLVVFGHVAHPIHNDNPAVSFLFDAIYLFHMPLFVFVSGLFAKGAYRDGRLNLNRIISFAALGVAFQIALTLVSDRTLSLEALTCFPSAPWYLISMAWWYLLTPVLFKLGPVRGMALALAAALTQGCLGFEPGFLALGRTMSFSPFFALGYYTDPRAVVRLRRSRACLVALGATALIIGTRLLAPHALEWFFPQVYGDNLYGDNVLLGMMGKLMAIGAGVVVSVATIRLVPEGRTSVLTTLGRRTLQVYVLHRLIRAWLTFHTPFYQLPLLLEPVAGTGVLVALTATIIAICWPRPLEVLFNRLLSLKWTGREPERQN